MAQNPDDVIQVSALARLLAVGALGISLQAHALQDFDACLVTAMEGSTGTVESVREVPLVRDLHAFDASVLEHSVRPETAEQLVVRLDAGPVVVLSPRQPHLLQAGQRVRVHLNGSARVERDSTCPTPLG